MKQLQRDVNEWHRREFPDSPAPRERAGLILAEETGEVVRCILKLCQGIRKNTDWNEELRKEVGDVVITLLVIAETFGFDLDHVTCKRFYETVGQRKFATA